MTPNPFFQDVLNLPTGEDSIPSTLSPLKNRIKDPLLPPRARIHDADALAMFSLGLQTNLTVPPCQTGKKLCARLGVFNKPGAVGRRARARRRSPISFKSLTKASRRPVAPTRRQTRSRRCSSAASPPRPRACLRGIVPQTP